MYYINFGYLASYFINKDKLINLLDESNTSSKQTGVGLDKVIDFSFDKLDSKDTTADKRHEIIRQYSNIMDECFYSAELREEKWVTDKAHNPSKGSSNRHITLKFMEGIKKLKGGREFFRAIKDGYKDVSTHPDFEVCLIKTDAFLDSINLLSDQIDDPNLEAEQIDFIKWVYWWGTKDIEKYGVNSAISFMHE
jgi:hypothetical protein